MTFTQQGGDLLDPLRQGNQHRHDAIGGQAITFEGMQVLLAVQQRQVRQQGGEMRQHLALVVLGQRSIQRRVIEDIHALPPGRLGSARLLSVVSVCWRCLSLLSAGAGFERVACRFRRT